MGLFSGPYSVSGWIKALAVLGLGVGLQKTVLHRIRTIELPNAWEKLEHVVGMICIALVMIIAGVCFL